MAILSSVPQALGGAVGGLANGLGIQAQNVASPVTPDQLNTAYGNTQGAIAQQQAFLQALQAQNGIQNQSSVFGQQQQLANQLSQQAMGQGPNPAQAQLAQATSANTANQAALMAGQRGASQNAGMIARQAAMQGGANQQAAVGQGATMQAQQQIAAQQALGQQQAQMANLSSQQVGQVQQANSTYGNMALQGQQNLLNAQTGANSANAQINVGNSQARAGLVGGLAGGAGTAAMAFAAHGGMINGNASVTSPAGTNGPRSKVGQRFANGGMAMQQGGPVPGQAQVAGDSLQNDKVPAMLSPGEIVIPRSITQGPDAAAKAAKFVESVMARQSMGKQ